MSLKLRPNFLPDFVLLPDFLKRGFFQGKYQIAAELKGTCVEVMTLSRINNIHTFLSCLLKIHFNIIRPKRPVISSNSFRYSGYYFMHIN
jgi:hypothetical protein